MRYKIIILFFLLTSCSPNLYINSFFARKYNISQNKYSKKKPYYKKNEKQNFNKN